MNKTVGRAIILLLWSTLVLPVCIQAQRIGFVTSTPRIDSFPIVRLKMTATFNGSLPQPGVAPNNLKITEDNFPVTNFEINDCDESGQAAVVFCVDASTSVLASAGDTWNIYPSYFNSFAKFISGIPAQSRYALVSFTDQVNYYPAGARTGGFYKGQTPLDSNDFQFNLRNQQFKGFTNVDNAVNYCAGLLQLQPYKHKAIVLVTDDGIIDTPFFDSLFKAWGITLYVMEIGSDGSPLNAKLAHVTGGLYMAAKDSGLHVPTMQMLSELTFGEHCLIRYPSTNPCPWVKLHDINLTLNYKGVSRTVDEQYYLGRSTVDVTAPLMTSVPSVYTTRLVSATENYPCTRGIRLFTDSAIFNFSKRSQIRQFPNYVADSLVANDTMQAAKAIYISSDSANNKSRIVVDYTPKSDTLPPEIAIQQVLAGKYIFLATEVRPWDKGLKSVSLSAGAFNIVLDSFTVINRRLGQIWVHRPLLLSPTNGCIQVFDSSGNIGKYCIRVDSATGDSLPPIITQDPVASPIKFITGLVTEQRPKDIGIKELTIFGASNSTAPTKNFVNPKHATISVQIVDSLQPVRVLVSAVDSVGNTGYDTLKYDPSPDTFSPVCSIEVPDAKTRIFHSTELAAWDRGIKSISIIGSATNLTVGPVVYNSVNDAQQSFTTIDPFLLGTVIIKAVDSADHICETTISIDPSARPLLQFNPAIVDFGTVYGGSVNMLNFTLKNPNEAPIVISKITQAGNNGVFTSDLKSPLAFLPFEQKSFSITFTPQLLGDWKSVWTVSNDTMDLAAVTGIGRAISSVVIKIDTSRVIHSQVAGNITVAISAIPKPVNIDSIAFDMTYDADMVNLHPAPSLLGNYSILEIPQSVGKIRYLLTRNNRNLNTLFSFDSTFFKIPYDCFVAAHDTSILGVDSIFASQYSDISASAGLISVGNQCANPTLRSFLLGELPSWIRSVTPNPATNIIRIVIDAHASAEGEISFVNTLGEVTLRLPVVLRDGSVVSTLDVSTLRSGSYQLFLRIGGNTITSRPIQVIH
ncbi:MAG: hypothetical protein WCH46_07640 [bacterium]